MEILKQMTLKAKALVALVVAGIVVGALAAKKHITEGLSNGELEKQEELLKQESAKKLAEETAKLEAEKEAAVKKLEEEKAVEQEKIVQKQEETKISLKKLAKEDKKAFKNEVEKTLGVKEKKGKKTK